MPSPFDPTRRRTAPGSMLEETMAPVIDAQQEAEKQQIAQENSARLQEYKPEGRPTYKDPSTGLVTPAQSDADWQAQQQEKQAKLNARQAKDTARASQIDRNAQNEKTWRIEGRPFFTDARGDLLPQHDDATWQALRTEKQQTARLAALDKAEKARQAPLKQEIDALSLDLTANPERQPLPLEQRRATEKQLKQQQDAARAALLQHYTTQAKAEDKGSTWNPFDNKPAAGAAEAKARADRLNQSFATPDAPLAEEDLATLAQVNPELHQSLTSLRTTMQQDEERKTWHQQSRQRLYELKLKAQNPAEWENRQLAQLAKVADPEQGKVVLDTLAKDLEDERTRLEASQQTLAQTNAQYQAARESIAQRNVELRRTQGIPADRVVQDANGETWDADLYAEHQRTSEEHQRWQLESTPEQEALAQRTAQYNTRAHRLQQAAQALTERQQAARQQQLEQEKASNPVLAPLIDQREQRMARLQEKFPDGPDSSPAARAAFDALDSDISTQATTLQQQSQAREKAITESVTRTWETLAQAQDRGEDITAGKANAVKALSAAHGIDTLQAAKILDDAAKADWQRGDENETVRTTSTGQLLVRPTLWTDEKAYTAAVDGSAASSQAKARAKAEFPALREASAKAQVQALQSFGPFRAWVQKHGHGLSALDQVQQFTASRPAWKDHADQLLTGIVTGGVGVLQSAAGALDALTGSPEAAKMAREAGQTLQTVGSVSAALPRGQWTALGANLVTGSLPAMVGGGLLARGLTTGATALGILPVAAEAGGALLTGARAATLAKAMNIGSFGGTAGLQTFGNVYADAVAKFEGMGIDRAQAREQALMPALGSALSTAILTSLGATSGAEVLLQPAAQSTVKKGIAAYLKAVGGGALKEAVLEEVPDQLVQDLIARATYEPNKTLQEITDNALVTFFGSAAFGGAMEGLAKAPELVQALQNRGAADPATAGLDPARPLEPHQLPETIAAAQAAIENYAPPELPPEQIAQAQARATTVLRIAQGESSQFTEQDWNTVGYTLKDGKPQPLKDYTGPRVLDFADAAHTQPVVLQTYIDQVDQHLPELHAAIGMDEVDAREFYRQQTQAQEQEQKATATADTPLAEPSASAPPVDQAARALPAQGAAPSAVPSDGGDTQGAVKATPAATAPAPSSGLQTLDFKTKQEAEQWLTDNQRVIGNYTLISKGNREAQITYRPAATAPASSQSPTGNKEQGTGNREQRTAELSTHLASLGLPPEQAQTVAAHLVDKRGVVGESYLEHVTAAHFPKDLKELGITGSLSSAKAKDNPLTAPANLAQRLAGDVTARTLSKAERTRIDELTAFLAKRYDPVQSRQKAEAYVRAHSLTHDSAATQMAQDFQPWLKSNGFPDPLPAGLRSIVNPEAEAAEQARETARRTQRTPTAEEAAVPVPATRSLSLLPDFETQSRALLGKLTLTARKRARTTLKAVDKALQNYGRAFGALSIDPAEMGDGLQNVSAMAVVGKKLVLNLPELLRQTDRLARSTSAVDALVSEEFIHRVAVILAERGDSKFSRENLVRFWNRLPLEAQQTVWSAYYNASPERAAQNVADADLSEPEQYHMAHEFIRMLVQDSAFAGRITETVDNPGLLRWISELLNSLAKSLRQWLGTASPEARADASYYEARLTSALDRFRGAFQARQPGAQPNTLTRAAIANLQSTAADGSTAELVAERLQRKLAAQENTSPRARDELAARLAIEAHHAARLHKRSTQEMAEAVRTGRITATQAELADVLLRIASGDLENRAAGFWGVSGVRLQRQLAQLGVGVLNRYPYTRPVEGAVYVERTHLIIRQSALDRLQTVLPITRSIITMSEAQVREKFELPATPAPRMRSDVVDQPPPAVSKPDAPLPETTTPEAKAVPPRQPRTIPEKLDNAVDIWRRNKAPTDERTEAAMLTDWILANLGIGNREVAVAMAAQHMENRGLKAVEEARAYVRANPASPTRPVAPAVIPRAALASPKADTRTDTRTDTGSDTTTTNDAEDALATAADRFLDRKPKPPAPRALDLIRSIPGPSGTGDNILTELISAPIYLPPAKERKAARHGTWDWMKTRPLNFYWRNRLFTSDRTAATLDQRVPELVSLNLFPGRTAEDVKPEDVADLIHDTIAKYEALRRGEKLDPNEDYESEMEAQTVRFERDTASGPQAIQPAALNEGDVLIVNSDSDGQPHRLVVKALNTAPVDPADFDPNGNSLHFMQNGQPVELQSVTLQDGPTYGLQRVSADSRIFVDAFESTRTQPTAAEQTFGTDNVPIAASPRITHTFPDGARLTGPGLHALPSALRAYHGTPHKVDKFSLDKIGTGEGAQAYGWGLYFAQNREVAEGYKKSLADRAKVKVDTANVIREKIAALDDRAERGRSLKGKAFVDESFAIEEERQKLQAELKQAQLENSNLYTVELLPDESQFLDWDKPLSEQSEKVKAALAGYVTDEYPFWQSTGGGFYQQQAREVGTQPDFSNELLSLGIQGIKYLDGISRREGEGTRNYVIFDENLVRILEENGQPVTQDQPLPAARRQSPANEPSLFTTDETAFMGTREQRGLGDTPRAVLARAKQLSTAVAAGTVRPELDLLPDLMAVLPKASQAFALQTETPEELTARQLREQTAARLQERQQRPLTGTAGEFGTPDLLDTTAGDMALFNQPLAAAPRTAQDQAYLQAVEAGDMATAQRMVTDAAWNAGFRSGIWYHGTESSFDVFNEDALGGYHFGTESAAEDIMRKKGGRDIEYTIDALDRTGEIWAWDDRGSDGIGPFFSQDEAEQAISKLPQKLPLMSVYLQVSRPKQGKDEGTARAWQKAIDAAEKKGFDAIIYTNEVEDVGSQSIVVFSNKQIKSADPVTRDAQGNVIPLSQRFNPQSESILYAAPRSTGGSFQDDLFSFASKNPPAKVAEAVDLFATAAPFAQPDTTKPELWKWATAKAMELPGLQTTGLELFDDQARTRYTAPRDDLFSRPNLESDRPRTNAGDGRGTDRVPPEPGPTGETGRPLDGPGETSGDTAAGGPLSADVPAAPHGKPGDSSLRLETSEPEGKPAGDAGSPGGSGTDDRGLEADTGAPDDARTNLVIPGSSEPLDTGSPTGSQPPELAPAAGKGSPLTPDQAGDVAFIERRLYDQGKTGVLLTNGTGTGKTFSGFGAVVNALDRGAQHILVVVPSDKIGSDWVSTARDFFGIKDAAQLISTQDTGNAARVVVTTYANLGQNARLVTRPWDMIVADEAHYLSSSKDGKTTLALEAFRALTWHHQGMWTRAEMRHPETTAAIAKLRAIPSRNRTDAQNRQMDQLQTVLREEAARLREQLGTMAEKDRPKSLFLSATPFSYHFSLDYAEGYLFDHGPEPTSRGYNTPSARDRFYIENFGYRMRTGKLTQPENGAATNILERRFAEGLMKSGAMAGRSLVVPFDYSRQFVLTESALGSKLDEIMSAIGKNPRLSVLSKFIGLGDYLERRYLLEAMKAREAIGRIQQHLAMGRKVVVFHDYKKGGALNPLATSFDPTQTTTWYNAETHQHVPIRLVDALDELRSLVPHYDATSRELANLPSPISLFERSFPDVGIFNGDASPQERRALVHSFNKSGGSMNVLLVQRASGKEGISLHDRDGRHQRVFIDLGIPARPTDAIQSEGRIYRHGVQSHAILEYLTTGTNFERWTFAQTIAQRASTAENLAMGERARALLQAFASGYNDAAPVTPSLEQGTGGKEADRARDQGDPYQNAIALYYTNQKKNSRNKAAEGVDYFATPEPLGYKMVEWAGIRPGEKVLEPSAGHGAIARFFPDSTNRHAVEPSNELAGRLALNAPDTEIHQTSFENYHIGNKFDAIVMNPPFGTAGKTAMEHLIKATGHLREGGRVIALIPMGSSMERRFDQWYESKESDDFHLRAEIKLPGVTFERAGTGVFTRVVVLDRIKPTKEQFMDNVRRDLTQAASIKDLFEQLANTTVPARAAAATPATAADSAEPAPAPAPAARPRDAVLPVPTNDSTWSPAEFMHTRDNRPVFVARIMRRLERDEFNAARDSAKILGGYYSSYKADGAIPGFHFRSAEGRDEFIGKRPSDTPLAAAPRATVDDLAHTAATSPLNTRPEPTEAQKKAGNYALGHVTIGPLDISIENPAGSVRKGTDKNGKAWETPMHLHYGYVKGSRSADGDHIDLFVEPGTPADYNGPVWVINQTNAQGEFDEHKAVMGPKVLSPSQALAAYLSNYTPGWKGAQSIGLFRSVEAFHQWATEATHRRAPAKGQLAEVLPVTPAMNAQARPQVTVQQSQAPEALPAAPRTTSPLADLGWNQIDRAMSARLASLTARPRASVGELVAQWSQRPAAQPFVTLARLAQRELFPQSILPREVAARKREMEIKTSMGAQRAMDLVRALSGHPKFSDISYPPEFAANPIYRKQLFEVMAGARDVATVPAPMQALAGKLRALLVDIGREAVKQGRMSLDTFENLRGTYMPHFYEEDVQRETSLWKAFRLGVKDILAQRTTAWHMVDNEHKDPRTKEPALVPWEGSKWRFRNKEHLTAFYEDFIQRSVVAELQARGKRWQNLTAADLNAPAKLDAETRGRIGELQRKYRQRYSMERPLSIKEREDAGLIMDPVYAIARYAAQMSHDNATAEWFNFVARNPEWTRDAQTVGFTQIPDNPRFGRLSGQWVADDIAGQILEMVEAPNAALQVYDTLMGWWKTGKTVLNPGTHMRNILGNLFFSQLAGTTLWNPANWTFYRQAITALRKGGKDLVEAYDQGVLGADYVSAELRQTLRQLLPDPATIQPGTEVSALMSIGKRIGQMLPGWARHPVSNAYSNIAAAYQAEDEVFKLAVYLKAKAQGLDQKQAAAHVRQWFPYFDGGSSTTLRTLGRTAMPFLGFYRESARIFGNALKDRPLALATGMAIPSLLTAVSAMILGLDDDDLDQVKKDMRGKAGKLLGPTPLEGMPLFSILLPKTTGNGDLQQFDISAIHPFVDFLGTRVENTGGDWWQNTWRSLIAAGPIGNLIYSQATGRDAFGDRTFVEDNMTPGEKTRARLDNAWKIAAPPLAPGGTGWTTLARAGDRDTNKTLAVRDPAQAVLRAVGGLDVRNASPDIYRLADDWRKEAGLPTTAGMDFAGSTPQSRARKALFTVLAQDQPNLAALRTILATMDTLGIPIRSGKDLQQTLFYRNPLMVISGPENQQRFRASLTGESRRVLETALQAYERIKNRAPALIAQARAMP